MKQQESEGSIASFFLFQNIPLKFLLALEWIRWLIALHEHSNLQICEEPYCSPSLLAQCIWHVCSWIALYKQVNQTCEKLIFCCCDSIIISNNKGKQLLQIVFHLESVWIIIFWLLSSVFWKNSQCGLWFCKMVTSYFMNDRQMGFAARLIDSKARNTVQDA